MKIQHILLFSAAILFGTTACHKENNELAHHHSHAHTGHHDDDGHADHEHEGHNHEHDSEHHDTDVITLQPTVADRLGVKIDTAVVEEFSQVVKVSGTVIPTTENNAIISAPTAGILSLNKNINTGSDIKAGSAIATIKSDGLSGGDANRSAKVELDAAKAEYERINELYADRLVTLAQYNAAKAALDRARAAYSAPAATGRATSPISGIITELYAKPGQYVETGTPIASVVSSSRLTLRADVPIKAYHAVADASDARICIPSTGVSVKISQLDGHRTTDNAAAGASGGYVPMTFSLRNDGSIIPGGAVEVYLIGNSKHRALTVPLTALVEQQGSFFVFEKLDEDCYRKTPVVTGRTDGYKVEILKGLHGGEHIVSEGVTAVKLAQLSGNVPEGHSHSH